MNLFAAVKASADKMPTASVILALIHLSYGPLTEEQETARAALTSIIEERHPEVDDLYTAALLEALKASIITA
jgi:hypothetical protein